jgi:hypothetical protein
MIGQGGLQFRLGPVKCSLHPPGRPDSVEDISPHNARKPATKHAQMHSVESSLLHDYFAWTTLNTMARYHRSAEDVPDGLHIPRWSWDGLVDR